jgi:hypothetical protein
LEQLADPTFDPFAEVLLGDAVPDGFPASEPDEEEFTRVRALAPERILIETELVAPGWLVISEWDAAGWQVWVDGERSRSYRANYGLLSVPLMQGAHQVELVYRPSSVYVGAAVSVMMLTIVIVCALSGSSLLRGRPHRRASRE